VRCACAALWRRVHVRDLLDLPIDFWPYEVLAARAWQLRADLSVSDGSYVALAEITDTTLATLDARIARAPGVACGFASPPV
jgi:predicted nucleic acid-binding protein